MRLSPYFQMNGHANEAIPFYEKALGATIVLMERFGDMPADPNRPLPEGIKDRIMHATLRVGETELMLSDGIPGAPSQLGNNVHIAFLTHDAGEATRVFAALADGGQVTMPLQPTFFSLAYGQLTDRFGVHWQVNAEPKGQPRT